MDILITFIYYLAAIHHYQLQIQYQLLRNPHLFSLMSRNGFLGSSNGRMVMVQFHIAEVRLMMFISTLLIRKIIINQGDLGKNT